MDLVLPNTFCGDLISVANELNNQSLEFGVIGPKLLQFDSSGQHKVIDSTGIFQKWYGKWYDRGQSSVDDGRYDVELVSLMNKNVKRISFWLIAISVVFALIAMLLINSSIRLAVYSKRFIIKTMQMVGATKHFIRRPFIWRSIRLGIIGSLLAVLGLVAIAFYLNKSLPELNLLQNPVIFAALCTGIVALGIIITWISTFFATQRFLNLKTDDLY